MVFAVDIDDTLLYSEYKDGKYAVIGANFSLIEKINSLYKSGHEIILYTGRHWNHLQITIKQLRMHNVMHHSLVMAKPVGDYYIDDKAILPEDFLKLEL